MGLQPTIPKEDLELTFKNTVEVRLRALDLTSAIRVVVRKGALSFISFINTMKDHNARMDETAEETTRIPRVCGPNTIRQTIAKCPVRFMRFHVERVPVVGVVMHLGSGARAMHKRDREEQ